MSEAASRSTVTADNSIDFLRQVEVLAGQGMARIDAIRQISITEQTYYRWCKRYGGMGTGGSAQRVETAPEGKTSGSGALSLI